MRTAIYVLILTTDRMKTLTKLLVIIIGLTTIASMAQKADSVIVIYDNQKTVIPLPQFGRQSSVSYSDTNKVIEIGVWLRRPGETSPFLQPQSYDGTSGNSKNKSKWFSEMEAGYIKGFTSSHGEWTSISTSGTPPFTTTDTNSRSDRKGFQVRLSVQEREFYLNKKSSIISGFKFGFSQSNIQAHSHGNVCDSLGNQISSFDNNYDFMISSFQFLYQFGYSYHFNSGKLPVRINIGNSLGILKTSTRINKQKPYFGSYYTSLLQPYLGMEIWKIGILFSADLALPNNHLLVFYDNPHYYEKLRGNISFALTYRIF
jgi:hypothetical protein